MEVELWDREGQYTQFVILPKLPLAGEFFDYGNTHYQALEVQGDRIGVRRIEVTDARYYWDTHPPLTMGVPSKSMDERAVLRRLWGRPDEGQAEVNDRISRDELLMGVAQLVSGRATCSRLHVGAVVSRDGRIIATGYNGAPKGLPHCDHRHDDGGGCDIAEHAERNAIAFAARYGLALDSGELHVTHAPCLNCARTIINAGLTRVLYTVPYRLTAGVELLTQAGLEVVQYHGDPA